ncbi:beta-1,4-galactosyltransferase 1-like isoform X3 [Hyperolius riggenbachi]|uniref:beta-1,4-galactosyltransferase 1-like isoform X3 n=1 Tax=Hyperolius riggenbachi TaxID=752182 RepID=UPI0035A32140
MHYFKSLMLLFSAVIVVFLLTMKTHYLDRYLERKFVNDSLRTDFWLKLLKMKQEPEKPCPILPPDLGPYEVKVNVSFENAINENAKLQLGGHSKPDNCTSIQKIAVIIPYRNREEHLKIWLYNMHPFLRKQQADYGIYVVEQYGETKFNKARLFNTGFSEAIKEYEYKCFFFNDVDVIPMDQRNLYRCSQNPRHLANALDRHNFRLYYPTAFGGIVAFTKDQFLKINGFSNKFWGWGKEDDELYQRVIAAGMKVERPDPSISKSKNLLHERDVGNEVNPKSSSLVGKAGEQMKRDGLNSLNYTIISIMKHRLYTKITVDIGLP